VDARIADTGRRVRHTITHRDISVEVWEGTPRAPRPGNGGPPLGFAEPGQDIALTALAGRLLREGEDGRGD
jgi:hypothetical protein